MRCPPSTILVVLTALALGGPAEAQRIHRWQRGGFESHSRRSSGVEDASHSLRTRLEKLQARPAKVERSALAIVGQDILNARQRKREIKNELLNLHQKLKGLHQALKDPRQPGAPRGPLARLRGWLQVRGVTAQIRHLKQARQAEGARIEASQQFAKHILVPARRYELKRARRDAQVLKYAPRVLENVRQSQRSRGYVPRLVEIEQRIIRRVDADLKLLHGRLAEVKKAGRSIPRWRLLDRAKNRAARKELTHAIRVNNNVRRDSMDIVKKVNREYLGE